MAGSDSRKDWPWPGSAAAGARPPRLLPSKGGLRTRDVRYMFSLSHVVRISFFQTSPSWRIICHHRENQPGKRRSAAVGSRYGDILPPRTFVRPARTRGCRASMEGWSPILLRPDGLTALARQKGATKPPSSKPFAMRCERPSGCGSPPIAIAKVNSSVRKSSSITSIRRGDAGPVHRAGLPDDPRRIRSARPNAEYAPLYAAAVARRQADQIYNLSLTRTATVILGRGARGVIGVGRVKTPTLAIVASVSWKFAISCRSLF